jgi:hypothetical protein
LLGFALLSVFGLLISFNVNAQVSLWSDPGTWGGSVPGPGATVIIPSGMIVSLDVDPPALTGIQVLGTLIFNDQDINLTLGFIQVNGGELRIGTESTPYANKAIITLTGDTADATGIGLGNKFIMVMGGGKLEIHGHRRSATSWTQIDGHLFAGETAMKLIEPVDWRVGDIIAIAPSGCRAQQTEIVEVTGVLGNKVSFNPPVIFDHFGKIDNVAGVDIDMRAEVGLLTRDILIQGDNYSDATKQGGHIIVLNGSEARIEGAELTRMGRFGEAGRYPIHWHFSGNSYTEYAKNNSIHNSYHRAIVTHGTNGVKVYDNVAYNVFSHMYVIAEDGNEVRNEYVRNLGLLMKKIADDADFAFPSSTLFLSAQSERHPGVFWTTSPDNIIRDNHAAGSDNGIGFFIDGLGTATSVPDNFFTGNVAHSNWSNEGGYDRAFYRTKGWGLFVGAGFGEDIPMIFNDFISYKNVLGGAWLEGYGVILKNSVLADNGSGVNIHASSILNVNIIGRTSNNIANSSKSNGAIDIFSSFPHGTKEPKVLDAYVHGFPKMINVEIKDVDVYSLVKNITFDSVGVPLYLEELDFQGAFLDLKGKLNGSGISTAYFGKEYPFAIPSCIIDSAAQAYICPLRSYLNFEIKSDYNIAGPVGNMEILEINSGEIAEMFNARIINSWAPEFGHRQTQWIAAGEIYEFFFTDSPMPTQFNLAIQGATDTGAIVQIEMPFGFVAAVYDQSGVLIPISSSIYDLEPGVDGWYFELASNTLHVAIGVEAATGFYKKLTVRKIPARTGVTSQWNETGNNSRVSPNPYTESFSIQFDLPYDNMKTGIQIYDALGRLVRMIPEQVLNKGTHSIQVDGTGLAAGTYHYQLRMGSNVVKGTVIRSID